MIALVDANSFFSSWKVFHPGLEGKPMCIKFKWRLYSGFDSEAKAIGFIEAINLQSQGYK